jgi:hypothetical protein
MNLIEWIDGYAERWGFKDSAVSASLAVHDWCMRREPLVKRSGSLGIQAGKYWDIVLSSSSASPGSEEVRQRHLLAQVARKLLAVMPNAAVPERVFSELGRMISFSRARLDATQSTRMLFIAANFRAQRRQDAADRGSVMQRTSKKFSERTAAGLRLSAIGRRSVAVVSEVPEDGLVEVPPGGERSTGESGAQSAARDEPAPSLEPIEEAEEQEEEEGMDAEYAAEHTEDEVISALDMAEPVTFVARFAKAVSESGRDPVDLAAPRLEVGAVEADFETYAMGKLPDENDKDIPQDTMSGFRSMSGSLAELFDVSVVGKLAPLTCLGVILEQTFWPPLSLYKP